MFGYVAWQSYEPPAQFTDTRAARRLAARSAAAAIAARLVWYVGIVFVALFVIPGDRILGIVLISVLAAVSLVAWFIISRRIRRLIAKPPASSLD